MNRLHHSRKTNRVDNITDLVHYHMESSDPYIVSLMKFPRRKPTPVSEDMKQLLKVDPAKVAQAAAAPEDSDDEEFGSDSDCVVDSDTEFCMDDSDSDSCMDN